MSKKSQATSAFLELTPAGEAFGIGCGALALATAAQLCILIGGFVFWTFWHGQFDWPATQKIIALSASPWAVVLLGLLGRAWSFIAPQIELATGTDINRDGHIGKPPQRQLVDEDVVDGRVTAYTHEVPAQQPEKHLVPVYIPETPRIDGISVEVIVEFIEQLKVRGHAKRDWIGYPFRNGQTCDYDMWKTLTDMLEQVRILIDRGERKSGKLRTTDPYKILSKLQLSQYAYLLRDPQSDDFEQDG